MCGAPVLRVHFVRLLQVLVRPVVVGERRGQRIVRQPAAPHNTTQDKRE